MIRSSCLRWNDPRMMWDENAYNHTSSIIASTSQFWTPDLAIPNAAGASNLVTLPSNLNILIKSNGNNYLTISIPTQQTRCALNVYKYPFDTQRCSIVFASWFLFFILLSKRIQTVL
jgi:hypothetical protein